MRYLCVLLIVLALPLSASAQGSIGLPLPAIGLPMTVPYQKPWEWTVPAPAWERNQVPAWEKQGPPAWERGHVARPVYSQPQPRLDRHSPQVIYVMQPYPVAQPYPVYVTVPAPVAPEPPAEPEVEPEPPAPAYVAPIGNRTLYLIPGCYLGNVKPDPDRLPAGCDISRMKTHAPQ